MDVNGVRRANARRRGGAAARRSAGQARGLRLLSQGQTELLAMLIERRPAAALAARIVRLGAEIGGAGTTAVMYRQDPNNGWSPAAASATEDGSEQEVRRMLEREGWFGTGKRDDGGAAMALRTIDKGYVVVAPIAAQSGEAGGLLAAVLPAGRERADETLEAYERLAALGQLVLEYDRSEQARERERDYDGLTGLPNRLRLERDMAEACGSSADGSSADGAAVSCLLCIDIERFTRYNRSFGETFGNALLVKTAAKLRELAGGREPYRIGGDEFALWMPGLPSIAAAEAAASHIRAGMREEMTVEGRGVHVSLDIGVSGMAAGPGGNAAALIREAFEAMTLAKHGGRRSVASCRTISGEGAVERVLLENELFRAVHRMDQFVLHYQPRIDLATGVSVAAEALIRWVHPARGTLPPGVFLPLAEEAGLMPQLETWVMEEACRQACRWRSEGRDIRISVNFTPARLQRPAFEAEVLAAIEKQGAKPEWFEIEITEGALMSTERSMVERIDRLRAAGLRIAIDDFGTGYSALHYLKRFKVNAIKLDKSFVDDIAEKEHDAHIAAHVIRLGHSLGLSVVAEGVETDAQLEVLRRLGCDEVQGYLLGRPAASERL